MGEKLLAGNAVLGMVRADINGSTARAVAMAIGVSEGYLSDVLKGVKPMGLRIPAHYGLKPVLLYEWRRPTKPSPPGRGPASQKAQT